MPSDQTTNQRQVQTVQSAGAGEEGDPVGLGRDHVRRAVRYSPVPVGRRRGRTSSRKPDKTWGRQPGVACGRCRAASLPTLEVHQARKKAHTNSAEALARQPVLRVTALDDLPARPVNSPYRKRTKMRQRCRAVSFEEERRTQRSFLSRTPSRRRSSLPWSPHRQHRRTAGAKARSAAQTARPPSIPLTSSRSRLPAGTVELFWEVEQPAGRAP